MRHSVPNVLGIAPVVTDVAVAVLLSQNDITTIRQRP
jgi:hypothetical protein